MGIFESRRGALHYELLGAGRPIVLIHGFTNFGLSWSPQLSALVHAGYRVILPDLHGHGASQPATALCTVEDLATDMVALLDHLGAGPTVLCGLSLGGMVAQQMAIDRPDRVAAIIVANSRSSFSDPEHTAIVDKLLYFARTTVRSSGCGQRGPYSSMRGSGRAVLGAPSLRPGHECSQQCRDRPSVTSPKA
jgi:pimeloyl-ACP methyl ester carboxylesterase